MKVHLEYDRQGLEVALPTDARITVLGFRPAVPLADSRGELDKVLAEPIGTPPLATMAKGRRSACILICDVTRPVPNQQILEPVLAALHAAGIPPESILILIATGLHRPNEGAEIVELVGERIAREYRVENHFGTRLKDHEFLGNSPRGVPIWIDRRYLQADLKITTGLIEPHFMAGYSGGRKLICPGIASIETIRHWHGPRFLEHPLANSGYLEGNPVHEENTWIARRAGCDFIVNVVLDAERRPLKWVAGDMEAAFQEGVQFVRNIVTAPVEEPFDIVITSGAGYPLDTTFYQSVKGICGAASIVKPEGTLILAAGMTEGIGSPEFQSLFRGPRSLAELLENLLSESSFTMDQWQAEKLAHAAARGRIRVVTDGLSPQVLKGLFMESAPSVEAALDEALAEHGSQASIAVIPKGPYVLAQLA